MPIGRYPDNGGWLTRANGATDTLDLRNRYLIGAVIRWRNLSVVGTTNRTPEHLKNEKDSQSSSSRVTTTLAFNGFNANYHSFVSHWASSQLNTTNFAHTIGAGASSSDYNSASVTTAAVTKTWTYQSSTSYHRKEGGLASRNIKCKNSTTVKWRLNTQNPRLTVVRGGVSRFTEVSGTILSDTERSLKNSGGQELLASDSINTITHGCAAYSDVEYGSSGQLQFQIEYEYIEYPDVLTLLPENIGNTTARLRGNLEKTGGGDVVLHFDYGETSEYGQTVQVGAGAVGQFHQDVFDLEVNQLYHYRARAVATKQSTYHGSTWELISTGIDRNFETFAGAPTVQTLAPDQVTATSMRLNGRILATGGIIPVRYFEYGKTTAFELGSINLGEGEAGDYSHTLADLDYDTTYHVRAYAISDGTLRGNGSRIQVATLYPYLPAPTGLTPESNAEVSDRRPYFSFLLAASTVNPALKYHARARWSASIDIAGQYYQQSESRFDSGWEAWIDDEWVAFPEEGVDPDTLVRVRPVDNLRYGPSYWDCASYDGDGWADPAPGRYGLDSAPRVMRLRLVVTGGKPYELMIEGQEWYVLDKLSVSEASNGEIGTIDFVLDNSMATNLLTVNQSSAEEGTDGFSGNLGSTVAQSYAYALHGDVSLQVTPDGGSGEVETAPVDVTAGGVYTASVSVLSAAAPEKSSEGESGVFRLRLIELDESDAVIGQTDSPLYGGLRGWNRLQVSREFSENGVKAMLQLRGVKAPAIDIFYVDCLQLEPGERITPWKLGGQEVYADEIGYGAQVALAVVDTMGNSEEFVGRVRYKQPQGDVLHVTAILGDGFLGERLVHTNYPTADVAKAIDAFEPGDDGIANRTEITAADWANSFDDSALMTVNNDLTLAAITDYLYYNSGDEGVSWVAGYSTGGGSQSKEATNLYLNTLDLVNTGGIRTYVSDTQVDLTDIAKLKADFAVIMGPEINFGSVKWGAATNKLDDGFVISRSRSSNLGRTTWEIDVSALTGNHYIKLMCGAAAAANISGRFYRVWGEDENGRTVAEYESTGYRVAQPLDLSAVTNVANSRIEWDAVIPTGGSFLVECGVNNSDSTEPASYLEATNGDPIPGIDPEDDLSGKYLWVKTTFNANLTRTLSPLLAYLSYIVYDDGHFGVIVNCPGHEYLEGDTVLIEGENHYNGTWEVGVVDNDNYVIDSIYVDQIGARGTSKYVEDIGLYFQHMINTYCRPLTADDFVDTETGFKAPITANGRYAVEVAEDLRRLYSLNYYVDSNYRVHFYKREAIVEPDPYFFVRSGESKYLRGGD